MAALKEGLSDASLYSLISYYRFGPEWSSFLPRLSRCHPARSLAGLSTFLGKEGQVSHYPGTPVAQASSCFESRVCPCPSLGACLASGLRQSLLAQAEALQVETDQDWGSGIPLFYWLQFDKICELLLPIQKPPGRLECLD